MGDKIIINLVKRNKQIRGLNITYCDLCAVSGYHHKHAHRLCDTCGGDMYYKIESVDGDFELIVK